VGVYLFGSRGVSRRAAGEADQPLTRAAVAGNRVALTFDVTWGTTELRRILDALEAHQVKATFFVGGTFLNLQSDMVGQMAAKGHEVGTLGDRIVDLSTLPEDEVASVLLASQSALSKRLGGPVRYFRPPYGPASASVVRAARTASLVTVTYSLDSGDQQGEPADRMAARLVRRARPGDIIRLTASDWAPETAKALPQIIQGLKQRGFALVTVSDLATSESP
jgi:peptidoglycan/xylan/chitin deacetylase (PgdA/CDA1 family)